MTSILSDLKHGFRVLLRTPLFTICTIAALAIGIGATTALFSVVHALLIRPLPYKDANQLVVMWEHNLPRNRPRNVISPANFLQWRERSRSFQSMAAFSQNRVTLTGSGEPAELAVLTVTANMFDVLGVGPVVGRGFITGEDEAAAPRTVILSNAAWQRQFGGDHAVIGRQVTINGEPMTIVGVMPASFEIFGLPADLYMPFRDLPAAREPRGRSLIGLGRLQPGVTRDQAQAEMEGVMAALTKQWPDFDTGWTINLVPLREQLVGDVRLGGAGAVRRGRRRAADRVRQYRRPDADARVGTPARARDSIGDRRGHRAAADATDFGIGDAVDRRRRAWHRARHVDPQ
ncbi:MAG: ABC transporter permease [Cyanobacteria bacterium]|nr:ABC transporter permease [Cyanobacteriota bacterium]